MKLQRVLGRVATAGLCPGTSIASIAMLAYDVYCKPNRGLVQKFVFDSVEPIPGSIVCCNLGVIVEHSGVYVGGGKIVHRDGNGYLASVNAKTFLERLDGMNPAKTIYVSCRNGRPVGGDIIANRARAALECPDKARGYNVFTKNCHQFCQYCVTGVIDNGLGDFSFNNLELVLRDRLGMNSWRVMK